MKFFHSSPYNREIEKESKFHGSYAISDSR